MSNAEPNESPSVSRRAAIRIGAAAATASLLASAHDASAQPATTNTTDAATRPASTRPATTRSAWMSDADVAVLDKLTDQHHTDAQRAQIARALGGAHSGLRSVRAFALEDGEPPAFHFDPYLPGWERFAGQTAASFTLAEGAAPDFNGDVAALAFASVVDLHRLLMSRKLTSVALTRMYLDRLKSIGPKLNCVITLTENLALQQAARADARIAAGETGVLLGIPYGLKDLFAVKGLPLTLGVAPFKERVVDHDADVVQLLEQAGAVLVAKTSLGELAMGDIWFGGKTRNPWDVNEGSSGSSAGSASGTAAGLFAFAIGTETHGSILAPCTVCCVNGLRPTFGRVSRGGAAALSWTMDKVGPIARRVEDLAVVFDALHQQPATPTDFSYRHVPFAWDGNASRSLEGIRIGIDRSGWETLRHDNELEAESNKSLDAAAAKIAELSGKPLIDVRLPEPRRFAGLVSLIIDCEGSAAFANLRRAGQLEQLAQQDDGSWPNTFRSASMLPAVDYLRAMQARVVLQRAMDDALREVDVVIAPPLDGPALPFTNLTGHPAMITRSGRRADGSPLVMQLYGRLDREDLLLRVALAFERATDWHHGWPKI